MNNRKLPSLNWCGAHSKQYSAKEGHPTQFLKVLHYALFGASTAVKQYLFANGVDPDTIHLNDYKFFKTVIYILVSSETQINFQQL